jgi:CRP-like cAMP-binding protein
MAMTEELQRYPRTGRFLMGRLRDAMSEDERTEIESLVGVERTFIDGQALVRRGALCTTSTILIEGFALRTIERAGRHHIVGIHVPGDFVDLHAFALKRLDHDVMALGPVRLGVAEHADLRRVLDRRPHLARVLWFSTLLDAAIHREWVLTLAQLPAAKRAAHVFCELWHRLERVGLADPDGFTVPLTQVDLASMCGATPVHMSRALRSLRDLGLATFRNGRLQSPDRAALEQYCEFDPSYLYGPGELRIAGDDFS